MTSATDTNKTTHKFGTVLRTVLAPMYIIFGTMVAHAGIPDNGLLPLWSGDEDNNADKDKNGVMYFLGHNDIDWFNCGGKKVSCNDSAASDGWQLHWSDVVGFISVGAVHDTDTGKQTSNMGWHLAACNATWSLADSDKFVGLTNDYTQELHCSNSPIKPEKFSIIEPNMVKCQYVFESQKYYCINPNDTSVLYLKNGNALAKTEYKCHPVKWDTKTDAGSPKFYPKSFCLYTFCEDGYTPSADKKSCVKNHCMGADGSTKYNSGTTESSAQLCNSTQHPNATMCEHTCNGTTWGEVKITQCATGYNLINDKCESDNCKDENNVGKPVDTIMEVECDTDKKYAKKCEKICEAAANYDPQSNPTAKSWSAPYIAECINDATPVRTNGAIKMCFLDKPYNDAIAKLKNLLNDIIRKCGNDGEHLPQESESPGPEPHVPLPLT